MMIRILAILTLCCGVLDGYRSYHEKIPNGDRVPHPCKVNYIWEGVGHKNTAGGGDRNPFGKDFNINGQVWDECICRQDSDGDGRTNGEELGDPDCVWAPGDIPAKSDGLSHPGVCEPVNSPYCSLNNDWDFCEYEELDCPALKEEDVEVVTLKFDKTAVPAEVTSYYCMSFDLGLDPNVEYHIIGSEPIIDNKDVMHHISIMGCADGLDDEIRMDTPQECGMLEQSKCSFGFGGWTVGSPGQCVPDEYGFKAGKGGVQAVVMQFHWNNPERRGDYMDESGIRLYVTRNLRPADAGILTVGTIDMTIPPGLTSVNEYGYCRGNCSRYMPQTITLTNLGFHMHYLGRNARLVHTRNGEEQRVIEEDDYSYDSPVNLMLKEPIEFQPGDELTLTCGFKSTSRSDTTYYGLGTADEMCFAFIDYYPAIPMLSMCMSYRSYDVCAMPGVSNKYGFLGNKCDFANSTIVTTMLATLMEHCNATCTVSCADTIARLQGHVCLQGDMQHIFEHQVLAIYYGTIGQQLVEMIHRCDDAWDSELFYILAGVIDRNVKGSHEIDNPADAAPRVRVPGECAFNPHDYEVAGAGHVAPIYVLISVIILSITMV